MAKRKENKSEDERDEDVYKEEDVEDLLDEDEISDREAGFMEGYDRESEKELRPPQKKKKK